jgi:hypothetical protein
MLFGVLVSLRFQERAPRPDLPAADTRSLMVRWRQSVYDRAEDPRIGMPAPALDLRAPTGEPFRRSELEGRRGVALFVQDGGT